MKLRIGALEMVTDQPLDISVVVLVGQVLPRGEIEPGLIEAAAETLPVLRDEARDEPASDHGAHEQKPIEQSPDKGHHRTRRAVDCGPRTVACPGSPGDAKR